MTGFRSSKMRWDCASKGCYHESLPCWDDINDAFPGAIRPTDIDGMVEINDHVLFIEQKQLGASIERGQVRAFKALSRKPSQTVLVIRDGVRTELEILLFRRGEANGWQDVTRSDLLVWLQLWARKAMEKAA